MNTAQPLLKRARGSRLYEGVRGADAAFLFSQLAEGSQRVWIWLCLDNREAECVAGDLSFFLSRSDLRSVLLIPGFEADPYRGLSPHPELAELRALGLWRLLQGHAGFVVTTLNSLVTRLPSPERFNRDCLEVEIGRQSDIEQLLKHLRKSGYVREDPVSAVGEFSHRGGIVDVFSPAYENPLRLEFLGESVESIREFNPTTQRSIKILSQARIIPMREMVISDEELEQWSEAAPRHWSEVRFAPYLEEKLQFTSHHELFNGFEVLAPLVLPCTSHLIEYAGFSNREVALVLPEPAKFFDRLADLHLKWNQSFEDQMLEGELSLSPERCFLRLTEASELVESCQPYIVQEFFQKTEDTCRFHFRPAQRYHSRIQELLKDLEQWRLAGDTTVFVMESRGMCERLVDVFREYDLAIHLSDNGFAEAVQHPISVVEGRLSEGFHSRELSLRLLTQGDVFEEREVQSRARKPLAREPSSVFVSDFRDLKEGDFVVHIDHGIGRFQGLRRIGVGTDVREFMELAYRDAAKLYVPVDRLDLVQKFSGAETGQPQLNRLGGVSWEKTKQRIRKAIRDLAEDLLKLYAQRELATGHAFSPGDAMSHEFEEAFEFEETADQEQAILAVKRDMESERPMDRLICGDVGYGKTEVAMRAAFKAVNDGFQVVVLSPTTILAFQHFHTFKTRFQGFPVRVEMASRFLSPREQKLVLEQVWTGLVDILIGTHRVLSRDVRFRKLGLVIVDEEQRFGVAQKEKLKKFRAQVDVLTLSATPIPRTLNMSLSGVRDLSVIETPPSDRLAVQTVVLPFNRNVIRGAIDLELKRNGQVFFVHNSVETIFSIAKMIQDLVPEARVGVAHGQMRERQLEATMLDFMQYRFDVLVATTIVENGLDIPRANTLIVNRSDCFGLSQLYQLRGRVGRSNRRAYAYFLIPSQGSLTADARKRLAAIREFSDLGAGFRIAAMDLEIRGAGNLLGAEQHGHIESVGLDLYLKLLEQTIRELRGEPETAYVVASIDLGLDIQIPEHYIADANLRLTIYKRISAISSLSELERFRDEVVDRHGRYPRAVANLFDVADIRLRCRPLRIQALDRRGRRLLVRFSEDTPVRPETLIELMRADSQATLKPDGTLGLEMESDSPAGLLEAVRDLLASLSRMN